MIRTSLNFVNQVTADLVPYPMEELAVMRSALEKEGRKVYDFGTGDPTIPTSEFIIEACKNSIETISQYPSVMGPEYLKQAHLFYLKRRFEVDPGANFQIFPSRGSKEAIFHIALSLIGRNGKKTMAYPVPGYPVYETSIAYGGGCGYPVTLSEANGYMMNPWEWPEEIVKDLCAIWINYPHNPTGVMATPSYLEQIIQWCHSHDVVLLSDECYVDIYHPKLSKEKRPKSVLSYTSDLVIAFMSLSKRSGMTGYRAGFVAGDKRILDPHIRARARFGLAQTSFIQKAAATAWLDDEHVEVRRQIFAERVDFVGAKLTEKKLMNAIPEATFYLWAKIPDSYGLDDVKFCRDLAKEQAILVNPSKWLGDPVGGYFRIACVPELSELKDAWKKIEAFL